MSKKLAFKSAIGIFGVLSINSAVAMHTQLTKLFSLWEIVSEMPFTCK